jgi:hypothetical protein
VTALEIFVQVDHQVEWDRHLREAEQIVAALAGLPGVEPIIENDDTIWTAPTVLIELGPAAGRTADEAEAALRQGDPPIMARVFQGRLLVDPHNLTAEEVEIVSRRLREVLAGVAAPA